MKASVAALLCAVCLTTAAAAPQGGYNNNINNNNNNPSGLQALQAPAQYGEVGQLYPYAPAQYDYRYEINDQYTGNFFGHTEARDGAFTQGSYYVQLPDSRLMKVDYYADEFGYHPTITYEGEAQYPPAPAQIYAQQGLGLAPAEIYAQQGFGLAPNEIYGRPGISPAQITGTLSGPVPRPSLGGFIPAPQPGFVQSNVGLAPVPSQLFSLPTPAPQQVVRHPGPAVPAQLVFQESFHPLSGQAYAHPGK